MLKLVIISLIALLAVLQYKLWFSSNSVQQYFALKHAVILQQQENARLTQRNQALLLEINNLKKGQSAIEEHARKDLGMVKKDETFYQVVTE